MNIQIQIRNGIDWIWSQPPVIRVLLIIFVLIFVIIPFGIPVAIGYLIYNAFYKKTSH